MTKLSDVEGVKIWVMNAIVLGREKGAWVICTLIGMNSRIRMSTFGSWILFYKVEKKGCRAKFRSTNKVNRHAISGGAVAGTNPYTVDEYYGM